MMKKERGRERGGRGRGELNLFQQRSRVYIKSRGMTLGLLEVHAAASIMVVEGKLGRACRAGRRGEESRGAQH